MEVLTSTILSIALSALISGIIGYLVKRSLDKYFVKRDTADKKKADDEAELALIHEQQKRAEQRDDIKAIVMDIIGPVDTKIDEMHSKITLNTDASVTLLRDRMKCSLNYCKKQGCASATDKANWKELYNSYKNLGGNHFKEYVDQWKQEMEDLPLED